MCVGIPKRFNKNSDKQSPHCKGSGSAAMLLIIDINIDFWSNQHMTAPKRKFPFYYLKHEWMIHVSCHLGGWTCKSLSAAVFCFSLL